MSKLIRLALAPPGTDRESDSILFRRTFARYVGNRNLFHGFFEISREPPTQAGYLILTGMLYHWISRLSKFHGFLASLHLPIRGCRDPSLFIWAFNRWFVFRWRPRLGKVMPAGG